MKDNRISVLQACANIIRFTTQHSLSLGDLYRGLLGRSSTQASRRSPSPRGFFYMAARQQGKTLAMAQLLLKDAVHVHRFHDGRQIAICRYPDNYSDKCMVAVSRHWPCPDGPIIQVALKERFTSVNGAMRYCNLVFGITEWNVL